MAKIIDREACRRNTIPTLIHSLTALGPLYKVVSLKNRVDLIFMNRGNPLTLKFSDEDAAADEGYSIRGKSQIGEVVLCKDIRCARGCSCNCVRGRGYVYENNSLFCIARAGCEAKCGELAVPEEDPPFTLKTTKMMIKEILGTYMESCLAEIQRSEATKSES